ncbi:MAG: hypothetical protein P8X79_12835 [Reinekea sp.]
MKSRIQVKLSTGDPVAAIPNLTATGPNSHAIPPYSETAFHCV